MGRAPIPRTPNMGFIFIKEIRVEAAPAKPMPEAKIREAIKALQQEMAKKSLTRSQQADFLRKTFPDYHLSVRLLTKIYQSVTVRPGRPKQKSDATRA